MTTRRPSSLMKIVILPGGSTNRVVSGDAASLEHGISMRNMDIWKGDGEGASGTMDLRTIEWIPSAPITTSAMMLRPLLNVTEPFAGSTDSMGLARLI